MRAKQVGYKNGCKFCNRNCRQLAGGWSRNTEVPSLLSNPPNVPFPKFAARRAAKRVAWAAASATATATAANIAATISAAAATAATAATISAAFYSRTRRVC